MVIGLNLGLAARNRRPVRTTYNGIVSARALNFPITEHDLTPERRSQCEDSAAGAAKAVLPSIKFAVRTLLPKRRLMSAAFQVG